MSERPPPPAAGLGDQLALPALLSLLSNLAPIIPKSLLVVNIAVLFYFRPPRMPQDAPGLSCSPWRPKLARIAKNRRFLAGVGVAWDSGTGYKRHLSAGLARWWAVGAGVRVGCGVAVGFIARAISAQPQHATNRPAAATSSQVRQARFFFFMLPPLFPRKYYRRGLRRRDKRASSARSSSSRNQAKMKTQSGA